MKIAVVRQEQDDSACCEPNCTKQPTILHVYVVDKKVPRYNASTYTGWSFCSLEHFARSEKSIAEECVVEYKAGEVKFG